MSQTPAIPQITGKMFLFERPELLNAVQHAGYGMRRAAKPFGFCAKIRAVPVTIQEMILASKHYPVIFNSDKNMIPVAAVGVIDEVNLFVDEKGDWDDNTYIPAYIRRYPFALANETGGERMAIVVDAAFDGVAKGATPAFFDKGEPSEQTKQVMEFCRQYESERRLTDDLMKKLEPFDIVTSQQAQYTPPGQNTPIPFAQYFGVDEARFNALSDAQIVELRKLGLLPFIYAQLMSLGNWRTLMNRRVRRYNLTGDAVVQPVRLS